MNTYLNVGGGEPAKSAFEDYTVTSVDPLRIQRDGDTEPLPFAPDSTVSESWLVAGDRVRVENADGRLIVVGRAGGEYDSGWSADDPGLVMGTGWSLVTLRWRIIGKTAHISIRAEATSTHTLTATNGLITNPTICTLPAPLATASGAFAQGLSGGNSRIAGVALLGADVVVESIAGTANIVGGDRVTAAGSYLLD